MLCIHFCLRILLFNSKIEITKITALRKKEHVRKHNVKPNVQNFWRHKRGKVRRVSWLISILFPSKDCSYNKWPQNGGAGGMRWGHRRTQSPSLKGKGNISYLLHSCQLVCRRRPISFSHQSCKADFTITTTPWLERWRNLGLKRSWKDRTEWSHRQYQDLWDSDVYRQDTTRMASKFYQVFTHQ